MFTVPATPGRWERELAQLLAGDVQHGIQESFAEQLARRSFRPDDVAAGRTCAASHVAFVHCVEGLHEAAGNKRGGHYPEPTSAASGPHD